LILISIGALGKQFSTDFAGSDVAMVVG
jgi:hypothetical protein